MDFPRSLDDRSIATLVALIAFAVYANSLGNGFAFDDVLIVERNPLIHSLNNVGKIFGTGFWDRWFGGTSRYRPFFILTLTFDYSVWKLNPFGFHLTNVLLHMAASLLFFVLCRNYRLERRLSFLAAAIFAVHPIHTEAVANIIGRMEVLGAVCCGLAWLFWKRDPDRNTPRFPDLLATGFFFLCAVLTKENFALFPVGLLAAEWLSQKPEFTPSRLFKFILPFATFAVTMGMYLALRLASGENLQATPGPSQLLLSNLSAGKRCLVVASASLDWYRLFLLGFPLKPIYDQYNFDITPHLTFRSGAGIVIFLALTGLTILFIRRVPLISFGFFFFFSQIFIASNIPFPIGVVIGERWAYLPSAGLFLVAAYGLEMFFRYFERRSEARQPTLVVLLVVVLLGGYSLGTILRNPDWKNNATLFERFIQTDPGHPYGYANVANEILWENPALAREYSNKGLAIAPNDFKCLLNLAKLNFYESHPATAVEQIDRLLKQEPPDVTAPSVYWAEVHIYSAGIRFQLGDRVRAEQELETGIRLAPFQMGDRLAIGNLMLRREKLAEAVTIYQSILKTHPDIHQAANNLGIAYANLGKTEEAKRAFETVLRLKPGDDLARRNLDLLNQEPPPAPPADKPK